MNEFREKLLDRMIRIYGFEHEIVVRFARQCERFAQTEAFDKAFETIVKFHEETPQIGEGDDEE